MKDIIYDGWTPKKDDTAPKLPVPQWVELLQDAHYAPEKPGQTSSPAVGLMRAIYFEKDLAPMVRDPAFFPDMKCVGGSPLMFAVVRNNAQAVSALCQHPLINIDRADNPEGWTPLHVAALLRRQGIINILLGCGADKNIKSNAGLIPPEMGEGLSFETKRKYADHAAVKPAPNLPVVPKAEEKTPPPEYKILHSFYSPEDLRVSFKKACAKNDLQELMRFTYAHKVIPKQELNHLLMESMVEQGKTEVVTLLIAYGASPQATWDRKYMRMPRDASAIYISDAAHNIGGSDQAEYLKQALLWTTDTRRILYSTIVTQIRLSDRDRLKELAHYREVLAKYSTTNLLREARVIGDRLHLKNMAAYAVTQDRKNSLFGKARIDVLSARRFFMAAVNSNERGFSLRMIVDGLSPFQDAHATLSPNMDAKTKALYEDFQSGKLTPKPYVKSDKRLWRLDHE